MSPESILYIILTILGASFLLNRILGLLNAGRLSPLLPESLKSIYQPDEYAKSIEYSRTKMRFSLISSTFSFVVMIIFLAGGYPGLLDSYLRERIDDPGMLALAFFGVLMIASDIISTPFSIYGTFVIEEKYGFNKTTAKTFILDKIKGYVLGGLLGGALLYLLIAMVDYFQASFWIWFWVFAAIFLLLVQYLYSTLLLPIFNKLTPLEEGELRTEINQLAAKVDFPLKNIMVMDGSKRSTKANAFFTGFGNNKRIVLFDTLIEQMSNDELLAILAHEIGHYKKKHIISGITMSLFNMGLTLFILSLMINNETLSLALGGTTNAIHLNLMAFGLLYAPVSLVSGLLFNIVSRKNEYEADAYAVAHTDPGDMKSALIKLHVKTLSNLRPHPADVFLNYSHPTLLQRLDAIGK